MAQIIIEQTRRDAVVNARSEKEGESTERFTTVGFEWDIAKTNQDSQEHSNILQGLNHVEIAESSTRRNELPYLLKTDAGNVLEFVTPPFYLRVSEEWLLPATTELTEIIAATRDALDTIVREGMTLQALMKHTGWSAFGVDRWERHNLFEDITWRNWSPLAKKKTDVQNALRLENAVGNITLAKVTLGGNPQINLATDAETLAKVESFAKSRIRGQQIWRDFENDRRNINARVENHIPRGLEAEQKRRIQLFTDRLVRVMAQQRAVLYIAALAKYQQKGWESGLSKNETKRRQRFSDGASFVKDASNVWLKTDLFSYGFGLLLWEDWPIIDQMLAKIIKSIDDTASESVFVLWNNENWEAKELNRHLVERAIGLLTALKSKIHLLKETEKERYQSAALELIRATAQERTPFGAHNPNILGVRQDTFINPATTAALSEKLKLGKQLYVIEIRKSVTFLEWLKSNGIE